MTLTEAILRKYTEDRKKITFVKKQGEEKEVTYVELLQSSSRILGFLQSKGIRYGDELVFQLNDNEDFIHMFWAGILGGMVPVPVTSGSNDEHKLKFFKIWNRLNNPYLLCDTEQYQSLLSYAERAGIDASYLSEKMINITEVYNWDTEGTIHASRPEDIAFIQFSSGSTGDPKGVVLKHCNLLANLEGLADSIQIDPTDKLITWLPLTHDMGIIGCHLMPLLANIDQVQIQTNDFIRRPTIWLEKATKHQSTLMFTPNFGCRFILKYLQKYADKTYDLSHVRKIINGAEPISPDLCEAFLTKMSEYKMSRDVMATGFGLAEASLVVTLPKPREPIRTYYIDRQHMSIGQEVRYLDHKHAPHAAAFVDLGYPIKHTSVRISNPEREPLPDHTVGFIEIHGINVTSGYYNNEEKTKEVLSEDGWLNTGDLGFMNEGRLVVIGRYKDVLFLNGQNYYAHDLERIAIEEAGVPLSEAEVAIGGAQNYSSQTEEVVAFVKYSKKLEDFLRVESNIKKGVNLRAGIQVAHVIPIRQIPKTTSGKVQRFQLVERFEAGEFTSIIQELAQIKRLRQVQEQEQLSEIERQIVTICKEYLEDVAPGVYDNFFELGLSSIQLNQITSRLQEIHGDKVKAADFYANSTIRELASYIANGNARKQERVRNEGNVNVHSDHVAIIGISVKLPQADTPDDFWQTIVTGTETVQNFPENRKADLSDYLALEGYKAGNYRFHKASYINEIDTFDYHYFKILPVEAIAMSPAQRLFLETAAKAIEDAGYGGKRLNGTRTGVYVGYIGDMDGHKYQRILSRSKDESTPTGYLSSNIAGRVSHLFNLKGPALMVDTACSSSLVALDLACSGIRSGQCEQAIAGGIRLKTVPIDDGFQAGFESADGRSRPFDSSGSGTGEGEGVVALLIKRLSAAIRDKDPVYAVIKGSAVNHDGGSVGLAMPNPAAHTEAISEALRQANVDPSTISYVEAQGTGTLTGDTIEVKGLTDAYAAHTDSTQYCSIGSVRANIGHLYEASGLSSVVKCCLMLKHKQIPPLANFAEANPQINFEQSPFYISLNAAYWQPIHGIRRCAVNNFGFSGTNAHVILEEYAETAAERDKTQHKAFLFTLSAKNKTLLSKLIKRYIRHLQCNSELHLEDICYTVNAARDHHEYRTAVLAYTTGELVEKLQKFDNKTNIRDQLFYGVHRKVRSSNPTKNIGELNENDLMLLSNQGNQLLSELDHKDRESHLGRIAQLYTRGANLAWDCLYDTQRTRRLHLPTYEFDKLKCWPSFEPASYASNREHAEVGLI
ncbi:beta-ketoacyl synthase N-terminal-like domain-containing protein [Paenibacillus puerhi]|uniref:beta-ketoacyl synthase N-terminal-like domain-containing protein n=1 Tax=Paenibacillus puerhi TaxID=2692622 RepID=UPI00135A6459|nr:beta-ketoacyl synthase N-terminal-like domain-containing protein [Paenibacillus puerhi]